MKEMIKKLQRKSNKKGFTLVEIIVVLVILAILAAVAVPSVLGYVNDAKDSKYIAEARSIYLVTQVEEAKAEALGETPNYATIATTAAEKTDLTLADTDAIAVSGGVYTVKWKDGDKTITAKIEKNKEVTITK